MKKIIIPTNSITENPIWNENKIIIKQKNPMDISKTGSANR